MIYPLTTSECGQRPKSDPGRGWGEREMQEQIEPPRTEKEFNAMMDDMDATLTNDGVAIGWRSLNALAIAASKIGITLAVVDVAPTPGVYEGDSLSAWIHQWYKDRYGEERLKVRMGPGSVTLLIRGTPWKMDFPRVGNVEFICHPDLNFGKDRRITTRGTAVYNVLWAIKGFPAGLASSLSNEEQKSIFDFFLLARGPLERLQFYKTEPFISAALGDLEAAIEHILNNIPHYGLSKWASLQFVEKLIKQLLTKKTIRFKFNHDLKGLAELAAQSGLPSLPIELINRIMCSAQIRYNEGGTTLDKAISAHHASIAIADILPFHVSVPRR